MGATIYYRVVERANDYLNVDAPSSFIAAMERAFGSQPWRIGPSHLETLRGMAAATGTSLGDTNPYQEMVNKVEQGLTIEVWPEY